MSAHAELRSNLKYCSNALLRPLFPGSSLMGDADWCGDEQPTNSPLAALEEGAEVRCHCDYSKVAQAPSSSLGATFSGAKKRPLGGGESLRWVLLSFSVNFLV